MKWHYQIPLLLQALPDRYYLWIFHLLLTGEVPNLSKPRGYRDVLQHLKLKVDMKKYAPFCDKLEVRKHLKFKGLDHLLAPLLFAGESPEHIPWDELPNRYVIKASHGCHFNIPVVEADRLDRLAVIRLLNCWLRYPYYLMARERIYETIQPRVLIETFWDTETGLPMIDYKFHCIAGEVEFCQVVSFDGQQKCMNFYDLDWKRMSINGMHIRKPMPPLRQQLGRPDCLEELIEIAKYLSRDFPYVRVDLYVVKGRPMFGELTFIPMAGVGRTTSLEYDRYLGAKILAAYRTYEATANVGNPRPVCGGATLTEAWYSAS